MTVLLEYLDLALDACSWVLLHNLLAFTQIPLYCCKRFLWWLLQLQTDFQLTALNGCGKIGRSFNPQIRSHNFDTGWVLCHISVVFFLIPFKPQKGVPMMVIPPTYMPIFNQFLPAIYFVGFDLLLCKKIYHNSVIFIRFQPKLVRRCTLISPICVSNFRSIGVCFCILWAKMQCAKWRIRKKRRNYFEILLTCISRLAGAICFKFGM